MSVSLHDLSSSKNEKTEVKVEETDSSYADLSSAESQEEHSSVPSSVPSSAPENVHFPGVYGFTMKPGVKTVEGQHVPKSVDYTFSPKLNKLFVKKMSICPFGISTSGTPPPHTKIKIEVYSLDNIPVMRCEADVEIIGQEDMTAPLHFDETGQLSILLPYNSQTGEAVPAIVQNLWFLCSSKHCINKELFIKFCLMDSDEILGYHIFGLHVCSTPDRDRSHHEQRQATGQTRKRKVRRMPEGKARKILTEESPKSPEDFSSAKKSLLPKQERKKKQREQTFSSHGRLSSDESPRNKKRMKGTFSLREDLRSKKASKKRKHNKDVKKKRKFMEKNFLDDKYCIKEDVHEIFGRFSWLRGGYGITGPNKKIPHLHFYVTVERKKKKCEVYRDIKTEFRKFDKNLKFDPKHYFELFCQPKKEPKLKLLSRPESGGGIFAEMNQNAPNDVRKYHDNMGGRKHKPKKASGTLTMFACQDGRHYALTCFHVLHVSKEEENKLEKKSGKEKEKSYSEHASKQRYYFNERGNKNSHNYIRLGSFHKGSISCSSDIMSIQVPKNVKIDCNAAKLDPPANWDNFWRKLPSRLSRVSVPVEKVGYSSNKTQGYIVECNYNEKFEEEEYKNAIIVKANVGKFSEPGDSGSLVSFHSENGRKQAFAYVVARVVESSCSDTNIDESVPGQESSVKNGNQSYLSQVSFNENGDESDTNQVSSDKNSDKSDFSQVSSDKNSDESYPGQVSSDKSSADASDPCQVNSDENSEETDPNQVSSDKNSDKSDPSHVSSDENSEQSDPNHVSSDENSEQSDPNHVSSDESSKESDLGEVSSDDSSSIQPPYSICLRLDTALENLELLNAACFSKCGRNNPS